VCVDDGIYSMSAGDGSDKTELIGVGLDADVGDPDRSPNGNRMAFAVLRDMVEGGGIYAIFLMDPDGCPTRLSVAGASVDLEPVAPPSGVELTMTISRTLLARTPRLHHHRDHRGRHARGRR
jgi:hypothetical protein